MPKAWAGIGMDDVPHLTEKRKSEILSSTPEHQRDARKNGTPMVGEGLVFRISDDEISTPRVRLPDYYARLAGIDFGIDHPTAVVWGAWDRDRDIVFIYDVHKQVGQNALAHAEAIRRRGAWIPVVWPHDGAIRDKGSGKQLSQLYREYGVNMTPSHFLNPTGDQAVEPGLAVMYDRMTTGRLKVFEDCHSFFEEKRTYHRKDGQVVKQMDDVMSAARYMVMSLRFAETEPRPRRNLHVYKPADAIGGY